MTVGELVGIPGLKLEVLAGASGLDRVIRWVHTSELEDPTPWLSGGELLLTTGMALRDSPPAQRSYMKRLVDAELAGLGFGLGLGFDEPPAAVIVAAEEAGFPILGVPYEIPFIALSEAVSSRLAELRLREAQLSVEVHERLAALVTEGSGFADVLEEVTGLAGGWAVLFHPRGDVLATSGDVPDTESLWSRLPPGLLLREGAVTSADLGPHGASVALAVMSGRRSDGVLVFGKPARLEQRDRLVVRHAVTVLGLLLASRRAVIETERRIAGDVLQEAFFDRIGGDDLVRRLELVGFTGSELVTALVFEVADGEDVELEELVWTLDGALGRLAPVARTAAIGHRVGALVSHEDPAALAAAVLGELSPELPEMRIGVGQTTHPAAVRSSYLSALFALRAAPSREIASQRDLGSYAFLLGAHPRPALEGFVRSVLGELIDRDRAKDSELVPSVRAFIQAGGRWEPGAEALGVHRHTLRYRLRQAEESLGRDLSQAEDRLEVWLALKALEILEE